MTRIIEKRLSLHKHLANQQQRNEALKFELSQLQAGSPGEHLQMVAVSGTHGCDSRRAERMASTSAS